MSSIKVDYPFIFSCLPVNREDYEYLYILDERNVVNFCVKEKELAIMFNYINFQGDYCTRDIKVAGIKKNIEVPHTKIIMHENGLECIIPYKLEEKASVTLDAAN